MEKTTRINAALYPRVSTERQVEQGFSLEAQKENLTSFAKSQGWNIYGVYADEGISGKNIKDRPGVTKLIEDIKAKKIDVVLLYKFDRLTRDARDTEDFMELIDNYGVMVYTLSGGIVDVSTPAGRFNTRILGATAQFERESIIDRVVDGFIKKAKSGYSLCSATPSYGYDRPKYQTVQTINEKEAKVVRRVFSLYLKGKNFTEICDILNSEKIPTKKQGKVVKQRGTNEYYTINSVWQPKTIRLMLSNVTYIGKVRYGVNRPQISIEEAADYNNRGKGFITSGLHEAIIDNRTWNAVQERLSKIKSTHRTNLPKGNVYYCGTLICGVCGHPLTTQRTTKTKKDGSKVTHYGYRCVNREKKTCSALGMSHKKVEKAFLEYTERIEELTDINKFTSKDDSQEKVELARLKRKLVQRNTKAKEIMQLFIDNLIEYDEYQTMKHNLDTDITEISANIEKLELLCKPQKTVPHQNDITKKIKDHWVYLTDGEKLDFLTQFVKKITIVNKNSDKCNGIPTIIDVEFYDE